jgi:hypothetical protein
MTREIFEMIEIDVKRCGLDYGVSPCAAVLGTTGAAKCYRLKAGCQDRDNYDETYTLTLRFVRQGGFIPDGVFAFPTKATSSPILSLLSGISSTQSAPNSMFKITISALIICFAAVSFFLLKNILKFVP